MSRLTNGNSKSHTIKNARSTLEVTSASGASELWKPCHELPKMQRNITDRMLPPYRVWIPYQMIQTTARMKMKK